MNVFNEQRNFLEDKAWSDVISSLNRLPCEVCQKKLVMEPWTICFDCQSIIDEKERLDIENGNN